MMDIDAPGVLDVWGTDIVHVEERSSVVNSADYEVQVSIQPVLYTLYVGNRSPIRYEVHTTPDPMCCCHGSRRYGPR